MGLRSLKGFFKGSWDLLVRAIHKATILIICS